MLGAGLFGLIAVNPLSSAQEQSRDPAMAQLCAENLSRIQAAAWAYERARGAFPGRLSELAGRWLDPQCLVCPVCQALGQAQLANTGLVNWQNEDPLTTYKWEFAPSTDPNMPNARPARGAARRTPVGDWAPIVRCDHHARGKRETHLNLAFNGRVYWSSSWWEEVFVELFPAPYLNPDSLRKDTRPILERVRPRDPRLTPAQIDLSRHVTALLPDPWFDGRGTDTLADFAALGTNGVFFFFGRTFDVRGIVQLDGWVDQKEPRPGQTPLAAFSQGEAVLILPSSQYPSAARNISIRSAPRRLALLCGGIYPAPTGTEIARLLFHYADGSSVTAPMLYGLDCVDGWYDPNAPQARKQCQAQCIYEGPSGTKKYSDFEHHEVKRPGRLLIFLKIWDNPRPGAAIDSLDFLSSSLGSNPAPTCPFLLGLTVE